MLHSINNIKYNNITFREHFIKTGGGGGVRAAEQQQRWSGGMVYVAYVMLQVGRNNCN